jgi:cell division protein FtsW
MTEMVYGLPKLAAYEPLVPRWWKTVDKMSLFGIVLLFIIGLLLAMAASPPLAESNQKDSFYYVQRQAFFGLVSIAGMIYLSMITLISARRIALIGFLICFVATAMLPVFGTDYGKGAIRWYSIISVSFQPSEFLKPCFIVFSAWAMKSSFDINGPPGRFISFVMTFVIASMLAFQPDFGQASLIVGSWTIMYFISGAPIIFLLAVMILVFGFSTLAYFKSEHVQKRINGFISPEIDPTTQLGYATNAIQEGGYFGVGVGEGSVKWNLPDAHTDFIIAVAAEEYGLLLCLLIILIYMFIVTRSLIRLTSETSIFVRLAGTGITSLLAMQALINLGVAVRLLPAKGMTLPFVSYGGSSVLAMGFLMGLLLAFTRKRPQNDFDDILGKGV